MSLSDPVAGALTIALLIAALALVRAPLGDYMARTLTSEKHLAVERPLYRLVGVDPDADQR